MTAAAALRALLDRGSILPLPVVHDAISARIAAACGFEAVFLSGYGFSVCHLGLADAGFATATEVALAARNVADSAGVPVIVDIDVAFGEPPIAARAVRDLARAGVAGVMIEDQASKTSYARGQVHLGPIEQAAEKIRALALAGREVDPSFVIVSRTEARFGMGGSIAESIQRGNAYADAGADVVYIHGTRSADEIRELTRGIRTSAFAGLAAIRPTPTLGALQEWGMALAFYGESSQVAAKAVWDLYSSLRTDASALDRAVDAVRGHPLEDLEAFMA